MNISSLAGKPASSSLLVNIPSLITAYYTEIPDPEIAEQRIFFGTSGHRGSSFEKSFNEWHILAITQAICDWRKEKNINGPLFVGIDTHALSTPAFTSAIEVLGANDLEVRIAANNEYTPTPVISHAILNHNKGKKTKLADGIVITPSHNPPHEGGFKYNPPNGGPAGQSITKWIEERANAYLTNKLADVKRILFQRALSKGGIRYYDFVTPYIEDLGNVVDMDCIKNSGISLGVDPLGGAGVHYWEPIGERWGLNLSVVNRSVDPTFRFMSVDWDGKIRMDPSSCFAMQSLICLKDQFDIAFACDTDHDRHGIVTKSSGLLPANHYLAASIFYLLQNRPNWKSRAMIGKTLVSSSMLDLVAKKLNRKIFETPVGFKWFSEGLLDGSLAFGGEESAGAAFSKMDGSVWTTDKDGIILSLLSAEMTAKTRKDPGEIYAHLTSEMGKPFYKRFDAPATREEKGILKALFPEQIQQTALAGEKILSVLTNAPGNGEPIGGVKVVTENSWFAIRPSGTENIYKIYAESFLGESHLDKIVEEAQSIVSGIFSKEPLRR